MNVTSSVARGSVTRKKRESRGRLAREALYHACREFPALMDFPAPVVFRLITIFRKNKHQFASFQNFVEKYSVSVKELTVQDVSDVQELDSVRRTMEE